mgnify:FL=1
MMYYPNNNAKGNVNLMGPIMMVLLILLIIGKVSGFLDISWIWVLSPIWILIGIVLFFTILFIILLILGVNGR